MITVKLMWVGGRGFAGGGGDEGWVLFNNGGSCFVEGLRERKERSSREQRERERRKNEINLGTN